MINRNCIICRKEFKTHNAWIKKSNGNAGKTCSRKCMGVWRSKYMRGDKIGNWVGDKVGYDGIHSWMLSNYGKANKCESLKCKNDSKGFVWAKLRDKEYERKRENFKQLCYKCHFQYDFNEEWHKNMINGQRRRRARV